MVQNHSNIDSTFNDNRYQSTTCNLRMSFIKNKSSFYRFLVTTAIQSMMNDLKFNINRHFDRFDEKFEKKFDELDEKFEKKFDKLDEKFQKKFDQLSQKFSNGKVPRKCHFSYPKSRGQVPPPVKWTFSGSLPALQKLDNIYESNAITSIMNKIRADHNLEIPFLPTNRIFHSSCSKQSKMLFSDFEKYLIEHYKDQWTKQYSRILVSMKPQQLEFDILGFAFEHTEAQRCIIESPNIEPVNTTSCKYLGSFKANTIICGEVTTSTLTFNSNDLLLLEKNISSNSSNPQRAQATFKLLNKLIQLERCVAFILNYYKNVTLEQIIAVLFGRFVDNQHHRAPEHLYDMVFKSSFSSKIPLLYKLYLRDRDDKIKQIYFIC
ncbi:unnamed protein product [Rotaria socialis]|uniref:Uncharacterized protein n=1 Tax=Rotaria socialis TaxID=392032 RepID=A0A817ZGI9_9BILA|nr:unnamed protein product [Rotaria socialis]